MDLREAYADKSVLITGGLGFIGSNLAAALAGRCKDLVLVDSLIPGHGGNRFNIAGIEDKVHVNIADVRDENGIQQLVKDRDYIFNLAGQVSHLDSMQDPYTDLEINCRSQLSILEACRKNNPQAKVLFAGTRGQYGKIRSLPVAEDHPTVPTDVNGVNKLAGESYHILYNDVHGIRACSLRLTNTYGPRHQMRSSRQGVLSWFIRLAMDGEEIPLYGGGEQIRDFNYVDDVVRGLLLAMASAKTNGQIYNLGSGTGTSLREAGEIAVEVAGGGSVKQVPFPENHRKIEIGDYVADFSKINRGLGWKPEVPLRDGIERTVEFYRKHRDHYWVPTEG